MRQTLNFTARIVAPVFLAITLSACTSTRLQYDSPQEAYTKGMEAYEDGDYNRAKVLFQGVFDFGRTHEWAAESQLFLARSYVGTKEYILAANEFSRFIQIYRGDPRVPDAEYELAGTFLARSPEYDLDQNPTEAAINQYRLFISRYPSHTLVSDAQDQIIQLRTKLARKQYHVAEQYERRGVNHAAAIMYEEVFDQYYDSDYADDALVGAMRSYLAYAKQSIVSSQEERLLEAEKNYDRLLQIFPDSPLIKDAEEIYREVQTRLAPLTEAS